MKRLLGLLLLPALAFAQVQPPSGGVQTITSTGGTIAVTPSGTTTNVDVQAVDVSLLTQYASTDWINWAYLPPSVVTYPAASYLISSANIGGVIAENTSSPTTVTYPATGSGGVNPGFQVLSFNQGSGVVTLAPGSSVTLNGSGSNGYLPQWGWALGLADSTAAPGNFALLYGGGYQFTSTGIPLWSTAIEAPAYIPTSTNCSPAGARLALYSTNGMTLCTGGASSIIIDGNGDMGFVGAAGGYLNFQTNTSTVTPPPGGGLYNNGSAGTLDIGTNSASAIHIDSAQNVYVPKVSAYSLFAQSSAGTMAGIGYGAANTALVGNGTTSPPSFGSLNLAALTSTGVSTATWTTSGILMTIPATSSTDTTVTTGTHASEYMNVIGAPTLNSTQSSVVFTSLVNLFVAAPAGTGNVSCTTCYGILTSGTLGTTGGALLNGVLNLNTNQNAATNINSGTSTATVTIGSTNGTTSLAATTLDLPGIASSSAAQTGAVCRGTGGLLTYDTTTTCLASDGRLKTDVADLDQGLKAVLALRPVSYQLRPEVNPAGLGRQVGLIAQEVQKVDPRLVALYPRGPNEGTPMGVRYQQLTALLVKALQEEDVRVKRQQWEIAALAFWCLSLTGWLIYRGRRA